MPDRVVRGGRSTSLRGGRCIRLLTDAITGRPRTNRRAAPVGPRLVSVFGLPYGGPHACKGRTLIGTAVHSQLTTWVRTQSQASAGFSPPSLRPTLGRAKRTGMGGDAEGRGRAVDRPFVHVTRDYWDQVGWEGTRKETAVRPVKSPACLHRFESCPCHTAPEPASNAVSGRPIRSGSRVGVGSGFPPPEAVPTPPAHPALLGRTPLR